MNRKAEQELFSAFVSFILSLPTLCMVLNYWNKTFILIWVFNMFAFYLLLRGMSICLE